MNSNDYLANDDLTFGSQLKNMASKLSGYVPILGLSDADVTEAINTASYYDWMMAQVVAHAERRKNWTTFKDLMRHPGAGIPVVPWAPEPLNYTQPPASVPMGIDDWFRALAQRIKSSRNYTEAIGRDLGIVATTSTANRAAIKPAFTIQLTASQPLLIWKKNGMDGVEIYKDSGNGTYALLIFDQRPNHLDTSELPEKGASVTWRYKMIYRYKDERVGAWSDEVAITVTGMV